jgi:hypothetical protein
MTKSMAFWTAAGLLFACANTSWAVVAFEDDFDSENSGVFALDYNAFAQWTVSDPSVDLHGNGRYDWWPGNGLYVDMDGSSSSAGKIISVPIGLLPGEYVLSFELAGCHWNPYEYGHGSEDRVTVEVADAGGVLLSNTYSLPYYQGFTPFSVDLSIGTARDVTLSFEGWPLSGGDNLGMLVDDVVLERIPAPGAVLLGGIGVALVGWLRRQKAL